jgi:hypothetical protein
VYFVHNRVHNIELTARKLRDLVPEASILIGHGQMPEDMLEQVMLDFTDGKADVLVCTTIIESGLDIPNVNTIIINNADKFGLAQLYQLRGRVGRGAARAYAYLLYEKHMALSEVAQRRLQAIFEATELGAGFQIALRDLEIRGAGNLLGAEQSGQIGAVGFDLYVRLLADAVEGLRALAKGEPPPPSKITAPITIDLPLAAYIPESYIQDLNLRLSLYQRMAAADRDGAAEDFERELHDRFGAPPASVRNLLYIVRVRVLAKRAAPPSREKSATAARRSSSAPPTAPTSAISSTPKAAATSNAAAPSPSAAASSALTSKSPATPGAICSSMHWARPQVRCWWRRRLPTHHDQLFTPKLLRHKHNRVCLDVKADLPGAIGDFYVIDEGQGGSIEECESSVRTDHDVTMAIESEHASEVTDGLTLPKRLETPSIKHSNMCGLDRMDLLDGYVFICSNSSTRRHKDLVTIMERIPSQPERSCRPHRQPLGIE